LPQLEQGGAPAQANLADRPNGANRPNWFYQGIIHDGATLRSSRLIHAGPDNIIGQRNGAREKEPLAIRVQRDKNTTGVLTQNRGAGKNESSSGCICLGVCDAEITRSAGGLG
jgi:hypothetical protein